MSFLLIFSFINILNFLLETFYLILFFNIIYIFFFSKNIQYIKYFLLIFFSLNFIIFCIYAFKFNYLTIYFQHPIIYLWVPIFNWYISYMLDTLSLYFCLLTTLLFFLCILFNWINIYIWNYKYFFFFFLLYILLINLFLCLDLFHFFIFFELILIPMFWLIGFWGTRWRKIRAAFLLLFFTLIGSFLMIIVLSFLYFNIGSTFYFDIITYHFSYIEECFLCFCVFIFLSIKIPIMPFHIWLPEAHVEAPTTSSVLLAGILLKIGSFGFLKYLLPLFARGCFFFSPLISLIALCGLFFSILAAFRQLDLKRLVAYSSISHMNLMLLGLFSTTYIGSFGALLQNISHGFVSSALFFFIGFLYDRFHTRCINYYSGLTNFMPIFSCFFLFILLANIGLPGTSAFLSELFILCGAFLWNKFNTFLGCCSLIISSSFILWIYNRIIFTNIKKNLLYYITDLNQRELYISLSFIILIVLFGIKPVLLPINIIYIYYLI